jgi:hypothetical protein
MTTLRSVGIAVGSAAMLVAGSLVTAAPASAAFDCTGVSDHQDLTAQTNSIRSGQPVRSGLYEECSVRVTGPTGASLDCYQVNGRGNVWWFVRTNAGPIGWVIEGDLGSSPARVGKCQGSVQPVP